MIATLFATFGPWIVGIVGALVGIVAAIASGKARSKAEGEKVAAEAIAKNRESIAAAAIKTREAAFDQQAETIGKANETAASVNRASTDDVRSELRDKWTRD